MNSKTSLSLIILALLCAVTSSITTVSSFEELGKSHCTTFPIEMLYRLSTGQLSQIYGSTYKDVDCYIRQFVNKDGQDTFEEEEESEDEEEGEEGQDQSEKQKIEEFIPQNDPLVIEYSRGIKDCLPSDIDEIEAVYAIWRFYRFMLQHDYALQWMRAKIRASLGYQAQRPSSWMDGEQSSTRVRLDKLFSNQFYDYVDKMMFKDFLHPIITFFKKNVVFAASGQITQSKKPILVQYIQTKNVMNKIFEPIIYKHAIAGNIFSYTLPGIPLLLGGTTSKVSWAFTGVLVDRSNIEQIQTLGSKFFHHGSQTWIKLVNVTQPIKIKDEPEPYQCKFIHSNYGTLYEKHQSQGGGKVSEYIARWHEKQKKVRVIFSEVFQLILNDGQTAKQLQFPFSSLVITNKTGIFQYICFQKHPSYFLYPDLASPAEPSKQKWVSNFKRNFLVVINTHLTTKNQAGYLKKDIMNPNQQQFVIDTRHTLGKSSKKLTLQSLFNLINKIDTDPLIKKRKEILIYIYRKAKFLFFPEENLRKECDQIVAMLEKWNHGLKTQTKTPAFILWDYFFRQYTFNYVSSSPFGAALAKHKIVTETYWTNQAENWKAGTSYGECDSDVWNIEYRDRLNGTGQNSTCYFNVMRGINKTRQILRSDTGSIKEPELADFVGKKVKDLSKGYLGNHIEEAFYHYFSKNLAFAAEIDNPKVIYLEGYEETQRELNLVQLEQQPETEGQPQEPTQPKPVDDEL